jgi:hypothetical protein
VGELQREPSRGIDRTIRAASTARHFGGGVAEVLRLTAPASGGPAGTGEPVRSLGLAGVMALSLARPMDVVAHGA